MNKMLKKIFLFLVVIFLLVFSWIYFIETRSYQFALEASSPEYQDKMEKMRLAKIEKLKSEGCNSYYDGCNECSSYYTLDENGDKDSEGTMCTMVHCSRSNLSWLFGYGEIRYPYENEPRCLDNNKNEE